MARKLGKSKKALLVEQTRLRLETINLKNEINSLNRQLDLNAWQISVTTSTFQLQQLEAMAKNLNYQLVARGGQLQALSKQLDSINELVGRIDQANAERWDGTIDIISRQLLRVGFGIVSFPFRVITSLFNGGSKPNFFGLAFGVLLLVIFAPALLVAFSKTAAFAVLITIGLSCLVFWALLGRYFR